MVNEHDKLIEGISKQLRILFENSEQALYVYLDDTHKICNKKFASLLGYKSPEEWSNVTDNIPAVFVTEKSIMTLIGAFRNAMEKSIGSTFNITWKKKSSGTIDTTVILVPMVYQDHLYALHFITKK